MALLKPRVIIQCPNLSKACTITFLMHGSESYFSGFAVTVTMDTKQCTSIDSHDDVRLH